MGVRATGVVVRHIERRGEKDTYEVPVIAFFDETGKRFEFIPPASVFEPIAREITILYPSGEPHKAVVDNHNYREHDYWFAGILSAVILLLVIIWIFD
ncbi:hypothetical protein GCM10010187_74810 [Actinomadura coerulea]|nr:hypothetical protein GCM10010187_74810 [Actinomadura coerulea]